MRRSRLQRTDALYGYAFIAPALAGFVLFVAVPLVGVFVTSAHDFNSLSGRFLFVGTDNYEQLLSSETFAIVIRNTAVFSAAVIPACVALGLALAVLVNQSLPGMVIFRTAYFVPVVVSLVAWSLVWEYLLQDRGGVNSWLGGIGIEGPNWLADPSWSLTSVIGVHVLKTVGISMVLFLAALQEVPTEIIEAGRIDGAGRWQVFTRIVLPLISPTVVLVAILATISSLKAFSLVFLLTEGGPNMSSATLGYYIYEQAFRSFQVGYASTVAIVLFVVVLLLTLLQWWSRKRWVFNES